ncbi:Two-component response regulator-like PRR37 [Glycine soja]
MGSIGATQSSWTKYVVEVDSPKPFSQWDLIAECPNSTCAQVVHSNAKIGRNKMKNHFVESIDFPIEDE